MSKKLELGYLSSMMFISPLKFIFRSAKNQNIRHFYSKLENLPKINIHGHSPYEVSCLADNETDENIIYISDNSKFNIENGNKIVQSHEESHNLESIKIRIPLFKDVFLSQISESPLNFSGYQCSNSTIESHGPLFLKKLKIDKLVINSSADIVSEGFVGSSLKATTLKSFSATNLICEDAELLFGGPNINLESIYCKNFLLKSLPPKDSSVSPEENPFSVSLGTLHANAKIEINECAKLNIGCFVGSLNLRQRFGDVAIHLSGDCPLVEIDVAEGDVELSLPVSEEVTPICGFLDLTAPKIQLDHRSLPTNCLDSWDLTELPGFDGYTGTFGVARSESETNVWRVRTLRGRITVRGASWSDAMLTYLKKINNAN